MTSCTTVHLEPHYAFFLEKEIEGIFINPESRKPYKSSKIWYRISFVGLLLVLVRVEMLTVEVVRILRERMEISG
jgi:hypothetical protein